MNFDEEDDEDDLVSSSSSQLNSNTRPGSATSKKSSKVDYFFCIFGSGEPVSQHSPFWDSQLKKTYLT